MIAKAHDFAKRDMKGTGGHTWSHTERVRNLAVHLAKLENANAEVVEIAAWLHDIERGGTDTSATHADAGAKKALAFLKGLGYAHADAVADCIRTHSWSKSITPETIEAKVLQDADRLDAIGAIGIARCFAFGGSENRTLEGSIEHFHDKLLKLKGSLQTKSAKKLADARHDYMVEFLKRFELEEKGLA